MSDTSSRALSGTEKAAVLVLAMGAEKAAQLVATLGSREIGLLAAQLARTQTVDEETRSQVLGEFQQAVSSDMPAHGGLGYVRELLTQALGEEKAASVVSRLEFSAEISGFGVEDEKEAGRLGTLLRDQHVQVTAAVLAQLPSELSARVLAALPRESQLEASLCLLETDSPDVEALRRLADALRTTLLLRKSVITGPADGPRRLAEILNSADWETEQGVLGALNEHDPELGKQVRDRMFVFDDLVEVDPRDLQLVLRTVPHEDLRLALMAAGEKLKEHILTNMSERAAAALKEEMETSRAPNPRQARAAQQRVAAVARQLANEGDLTLKRTDENGEPEETGSEEEREPQAPAPQEEEAPEERPEAETRGEEG